MSAAPVSRRTILVSAVASAGAAALPSGPTLISETVFEGAAGQISAPSLQFFRYGLSLNGGQTMFAVYEQLADGVIRVTEDDFGPGEILSFWANGLGQFFDISEPPADDYVDVRKEPVDGDEDDWGEVVEEYRYKSAHFDVKPGAPHYEAVCRAMKEAGEVQRRWEAEPNLGIDFGDDADGSND